MSLSYRRGCTAVDETHIKEAWHARMTDQWWWLICDTCHGVVQGGVRGLRAHCRVVHLQLQVNGTPKEEQRWTPPTNSSSTESKSHLSLAWSSTTDASPETSARTD